MKHRLPTVVLVAFVAIASSALCAATDPVRVEQGQLSGTAGTHPEVRVFRGIPYAAPPVGDLRWKPPQPAAAWKGVREANKFSATCWQKPYPPQAAIFQNDISNLSEDCLYLNIWTPAKTAGDRLPVMVWIHGGGFTRGTANSPAYDGEDLALKGVVVVTLNYRLGILGFLAHQELTAESEHHVSGNYGVLDQISALQWVKKNIAAFGGDADRVTIFGESAGSYAVCALMASPLAKGLFARAIGESGALFTPLQMQAVAEQEGEKLATQAGAVPSDSNKRVLKALRAKSPEELVKVTGETNRPVIDGWVLPQDVYSVFAQGKQNDVALLLGNNADEGTVFAPPAEFVTAQLFAAGAHQRFGDMGDQFLKIYPASTDQEAFASYLASFRDLSFGWEMRTWARMQVKTGHHAVYRYYFTRRPPGPQNARLGAFHASEIPYVFGNFVWPFPWENTDHMLHEIMAGYWVSFATTGNPNTKGLPAWPAYDPEKDTVLELGDHVQARSGVNKAGLDFFDAFFMARLQPKAAAGTGK
jgi:para-nitrobenzyl esterase